MSRRCLGGEGYQLRSTIYSEYFENGRTPNYSVFVPTHRNRKREQMQVIRLDDFAGRSLQRRVAFGQLRNLQRSHWITQEAKNLASTPAYAAKEKEMKDTVLRLRRPDETAPRPHDTNLVPALTSSGLEQRPRMAGIS